MHALAKYVFAHTPLVRTFGPLLNVVEPPEAPSSSFLRAQTAPSNHSRAGLRWASWTVRRF